MRWLCERPPGHRCRHAGNGRHGRVGRRSIGEGRRPYARLPERRRIRQGDHRHDGSRRIEPRAGPGNEGERAHAGLAQRVRLQGGRRGFVRRIGRRPLERVPTTWSPVRRQDGGRRKDRRPSPIGWHPVGEGPRSRRSGALCKSGLKAYPKLGHIGSRFFEEFG